MKTYLLNLFRKITVISIICLLVFSTISCSNQTNSLPTETNQATATPVQSNVDELPTVVKSAVLSDATQRVSKPVAALRITQAQKQSWGDGCLGLAEPGKVCTQVIVPGWKVVVSDGLRELVYRTDDKGRQVKLEDL